ncbi:glycoside hydrolase superfamily [Xylariomycetidae sp. FL2044]|nr:glycoside hydrolase superfamily [Xylariomycetidae sp. FL2044]
MRFPASSTLAATAFGALAAAETYQGFNSGALKADDSAKFKEDFVAEFTTAQNLEGAPGTFNAVRLYTNIQAYSDSDPIEAFEAAIDTKTFILLGIWTSGTDSIEKEITALKAGLEKYGDDLANLIIGISIGSEDLYRNSVTGITNKAGIGADPDVIVNFIDEFKDSFKDSLISDIPIGHVDTWDVWPNGTNQAVIDAVDWIGVDEYPYYQNATSNSIENSGALFKKAYDAVVAAVGGKPVWVTETGWPTTGPNWDEAEPSIDNAKVYWDDVGCDQLFGQVNTFWYNLRDSNSANSMKFAITDNLSTTPYFDLSCPEKSENSTSSSTSASASGSSTATVSGSSSGVASATASATGAGSSSTGTSSSTTTSSGSVSDSEGTGSDSTESSPASTTSPVTAGARSAHGLSAISAVVALAAAVYLL